MGFLASTPSGPHTSAFLFLGICEECVRKVIVGLQAPTFSELHTPPFLFQGISEQVMYSARIHSIRHLKQPIKKLQHLSLLMFSVEHGRKWNIT
jgi:hypothetical protein